MTNKPTPEVGAEIIDNLLCIFGLYKEDYSIVKDALAYIAAVRNCNPRQPITVALANHMREKGLIE